MNGGATQTFGPLEEGAFMRSSAVCIGTGRFLRAVLVPALHELGCDVILAQTRGQSFGQYMQKRLDEGAGPKYELDTVLHDGSTLTTLHPITACGSLGAAEGRAAFMALPAKLKKLRFIGLGVTEAGITHNGSSMLALAEFLHACYHAGRAEDGPQLSIINTDNLPFNGDEVRAHVLSCDFTQAQPDAEAFGAWLARCVCFHNTMVDCITSQREGCPEVPRAEPLPYKAIVIEDLQGLLPAGLSTVPGLAARTQPNQLALDIQLKLRVANGLHSAMVYAMALGRQPTTDLCAQTNSPILPYLEQLFERDVVHMTSELGCERAVVTPVYTEWMTRLQHRHFGLCCFFVSQNAMQKLGIRLLPSIKATLLAAEAPSDFMAFSIAAMLRFLTPMGEQTRLGEGRPVFVGKLDDSPALAQPCPTDEPPPPPPDAVPPKATPARFEYTPGLRVDLEAGTYEFCDGDGLVPLLLRPLGRTGGTSAVAVGSITEQVLSTVEG